MVGTQRATGGLELITTPLNRSEKAKYTVARVPLTHNPGSPREDERRIDLAALNELHKSTVSCLADRDCPLSLAGLENRVDSGKETL